MNQVFSFKLRDLLESRGLSQSWLAEKLGTSEATVSRYVNGTHLPSMPVIMKLCDLLNVSMDYLFGRTLSPTTLDAPTQDIAILCNVYNRADVEHKRIVWTVLQPSLTDEEKNYVTLLAASGFVKEIPE